MTLSSAIESVPHRDCGVAYSVTTPCVAAQLDVGPQRRELSWRISTGGLTTDVWLSRRRGSGLPPEPPAMAA
jgi:hypothetical protein